MSQTPPVLDRLWDEIPTGRPPFEDLLTAGRTRRGRRRTAAVLATAVVLMAGAGFATANRGSDGPGATDPAQPSVNRVADPSVPDGYRLVGLGHVAIAVPETWAINAAGCNTPTQDTAFFPYGQDCVIPGPDSPVSSVAITRGEFTETGLRLAALRPAAPVAGHRVVESTGVCATSLPGACTQMFGVPDLHAYFSVTIAGDADDPGRELGTIRASLRVVSDDERAVPSIASFAVLDAGSGAARRELESAGFAVEVRRTPCPDTASCLSGVTGTEPAAGTIVPVGSTVVVDVVG